MSEKPEQEKEPQEGAPVSRETGKGEPREAAGKRNHRSSVYIYLLILFGAAFMMLLLAYFVQQRNNEAVRDDLRSTTASREELVEENQKLTEEKSELEAQVAQLEEDLEQAEEIGHEFEIQYDGARNTASHLEYYLYKRSEAMELFWQLDRAYTQGQEQRCLELLELMENPEAEPLKNYLPDRGERDQYDNGGYADDWPSPAERYQEIYEKLS